MVGSKARQMKLSAFLSRDGSYHLAGWRHPDAAADGGTSFAQWLNFARILERGKFDMLFIADGISPSGVDHLESLSHSPRASGFEPLTLLSALASVTECLGLAATVPTTWYEPYIVARMMASLDQLSAGRAGWNLVTGRNAEDAKNFSRDEHFTYGDRYSRAEEFIDVVHGLWDSYDDDALLMDRSTGRFFDPAKLHLLNHRGQHFSVKGPLSVTRPPQGHPVVIQAGDSEAARELAARTADAMFTAQLSLESAIAFYADIKGRLAKFGRSRDSLKILPGVNLYVGRTTEEAEEKFEQLQSLIPRAYAVQQLSVQLGGVDLSTYPLDGPMPDVEATRSRANPMKWLAFARQENLTLLQTALRAAASKSHWVLKGSPKHVADQLELWFTSEACDGFNLLPPVVPGDLTDFVDLVIPELRRRGLFRSEYEGRTLRENLGLARPPDMSAIPREVSASA
jgi:FMN-dependent oxidoreductase (nitrilotriacetate monooxygenase family)